MIAAALAAHILIHNYTFDKPSLTVCRGTTVTWTNKDDDPHTITAVGGAFDSKGLDNGGTFAFTFSKDGIYKYFCAVHPFMQAVVKVKECPS